MAATANDTNSKVLYRTEYGRERDGSISGTVVGALAAVENVDSENLDVGLYDSIESDALDTLYRTAAERSERLHVTFTIGAYEVTVEDDGRVAVRKRGDGPKRNLRPR
jgi:hypothetical protein